MADNFELSSTKVSPGEWNRILIAFIARAASSWQIQGKGDFVCFNHADCENKKNPLPICAKCPDCIILMYNMDTEGLNVRVDKKHRNLAETLIVDSCK